MDCSKTEAFFAEWKRMCNSVENSSKCAFIANGLVLGCTFCEANVRIRLKEKIEIVQQWSNEHPRETRKSGFLELFPNALLDNEGIIGICPKIIDNTFVCNIASRNCSVCKKEYWLAEVEE